VRRLCAEIVDGIAVIVNGDIITLSELEERLGSQLPSGIDADTKAKYLRRAAEDAATDKLMAKECAEQGITPTDAEVANTIDDVRRENGNIDMATLEKALGAQGLTMARYRQEVGNQLCKMKIIESKVKPRVNVSEDDIRAQYAKSAGNVKPTEEAHIRDIFVSAEEGSESARAKVVAAQKRIAAGEEFEKVARETGGPLADSGGDLGWMKEGDLAPELKGAYALPKGSVSPIIETKEGFHLLKVEDRRQATSGPTYSQAHDTIKQQLVQQKLEKAAIEYINDLRRNADIEYHIP